MSWRYRCAIRQPDPRPRCRSSTGPYRALIGTIFIFILSPIGRRYAGRRGPDRPSETDGRLEARSSCYRRFFYGVSGDGHIRLLATFTKPGHGYDPRSISSSSSAHLSLISSASRQSMRGVSLARLGVSGGLCTDFTQASICDWRTPGHHLTVLGMSTSAARTCRGRPRSSNHTHRKVEHTMDNAIQLIRLSIRSRSRNGRFIGCGSGPGDRRGRAGPLQGSDLPGTSPIRRHRVRRPSCRVAMIEDDGDLTLSFHCVWGSRQSVRGSKSRPDCR